jgi:hypothetical protein
MSENWLTPIRETLETLDKPITLFFRDDDAGWADNRLFALLDCFASHNIPIDLAVIPQELQPPLANHLLKRKHSQPKLLGLHQHGYAHCNHELEGRRCEFGASRDYASQFLDLKAGHEHLLYLLDSALDLIFTPPWNRCNDTTSACLVDLGFSALSRNRGAALLADNTLPELPITIDWCGIRARADDPWSNLAQTIVTELRHSETKPIGLMLHHAVMDDDDLRYMHALLALLAGHDRILCRLMQPLVQAA